MPSIPIFTRSTDGVLLTEKGGSFLYRLKVPIRVPYGVEPTIALTGASVWYVNPNVLEGVNDTIYLYFSGLNGSGNEVQNLVFEKGPYSLKALNRGIEEKLLAAAGGGVFAGDEVILAADDATQKLKITLNPKTDTGTLTVVFGGARDMAAGLLGFTTPGAFSAGVASGAETTTAPEVARFNSLSYYIVHVDGLSSGVLDSRGSDTGSEIAVIAPANISPGKQIVERPYNILEVPCNAAGRTISEFTVRLTDQSNREVNMLGEEFSVQMRIRW